MADRTRPTDFTKGPPCILCGWPNVKPGHNRNERRILREGLLRDVIAALFTSIDKMDGQ